jgi:hypothetical protein
MHRKFFGSAKRRALSILAVLVFMGGAGFGAAQLASAAGAQNVLCAKNGSRQMAVFSGTCPTGFFRAQLTASDVYGLGVPAGNVDVAALVKAEVAKQIGAIPAGLTPKKDSATFNADWATNSAIKTFSSPTGLIAPAPNTAGYLKVGDFTFGPLAPNGARRYFAVVQTGVTAYSASTRELFGSNVASSTMASESDVQVEGVIQPAPGATTRTFVVSVAAGTGDDVAGGKLAAFANSRHFVLEFFTYV